VFPDSIKAVKKKLGPFYTVSAKLAFLRFGVFSISIWVSMHKNAQQSKQQIREGESAAK
jgi:hypothetical protein